MSESNRVRLAAVLESQLGVTPASPRLRQMRITGETLAFKPVYESSAEIRSDRMNVAPVLVGRENMGNINHEMHYPVDNSTLSNIFQSLFLNTWQNTPERDNDGTAAAVITNVAAAGGVVTVTTGPAFVAQNLVKFSGFGQSANNGVFLCSTGSATVPAFSGAGLVNEASPAAAARIKVVGVQGTSGDITATSTGLASTALDFTTLGLQAGQWIKIGGTAVGNRFATVPADNDWVRISAAPAAHALALDNLPSGWGVDAGTGKTISIFYGDVIINGTTLYSLSIERAFLDHSPVDYIQQVGMCADKWNPTFEARKIITGGFDFVGMTGASTQTSLDGSTPDSPPDQVAYPIMAGSANIVRIAQNGVPLTKPNWVKSIKLSINNNLGALLAADSIDPVGIYFGSADIDATAETYFGDATLYGQLLAGSSANLSWRAQKNSQALIFELPMLTAIEGNPNATKKNERVMLPLKLQASRDALTNSHMMMMRQEYYET